MNVTIIGAGYVGLVSGACLAEHGHTVTGVDVDAQKIAQLKKGQSPIYEEGLEGLIKRNIAAKRLFFTTDLADSASMSEVISMAVGTPSANDGSVNLSYINQAAQEIGRALAKAPKQKRFPYYVVAIKSTVPVGTGQLIDNLIRRHYNGRFSVVSNPEFLREGQAVNDFMNPDRIVVGVDDPPAQAVMAQLYASFDCPIVWTNRLTSEMIKYAANTYLATSISFINSLSQLCESVGADVTEIVKALRLDHRIGPRAFLAPGPAWGGSCFPKDVKGLITLAHRHQISLPVIEAALTVNDTQRRFVVNKIAKHLSNSRQQKTDQPLQGKKLAIWGLAFKAHTDDVRDSPAISIIQQLIQLGAKIHAHDPAAELNARAFLPSIRYAPSPYETVHQADAIVVLTDWPAFLELDFTKVASAMKSPMMIDLKNMFEPAKIQKHGFRYIGLGR